MPDRLPPGVPLPQLHSQGQRVVAVPRVLQAASDPFLGWITVDFAALERAAAQGRIPAEQGLRAQQARVTGDAEVVRPRL